ncbi:PREDICTED: glutathione S-transferase T3-like [Brassica oleracea var. oleracea]|uniref:glutathione S-transferase T3-like n=1 Tax=Brassica oleracea var. oleracea TaxID=109376 RepID=UPI0006A7362B|nr:PREDICTED: glutathione S-transferase T3-like [Brassica oleracea var. oleracea]
MSGYRHLLYSQMPSRRQVPEESVKTFADRRKYSPKEDRILIGAWLNTSEEPLVGNERSAVAFWKRIVDYYNASPQLVGQVPREVTSCKQRWSRINHEVSRFTGCYNQALGEQRSGQNDDDVIKAAYDIFFTKYDTKFTLDHCWRDLRHEQKWASTYMAKDGGKEKRRPVVDLDGPEENVVGEDEDRPVGVKAAKGASKKKKSGRDEELSKLQGVLELKEKLSRNKLLDRLLAKKEPLSEIETTLKMKLILLHYKNVRQQFVYLLMKIRLTRLTNISDLLFGDEYLRRPKAEDLQRLLDMGEKRGFPGMVGSIDCMH